MEEAQFPSLIDAEAGSAGSLALAQHMLTIAATTLSWTTTATGATGGSVKLADVLTCHALDSPPRMVVTAYPRRRSGCMPSGPTRQREEHTVRAHPLFFSFILRQEKILN